MSKRKGGWGLAAVAGVGALIALGGMAAAQAGGSGGGWPGGGGSGGGGGTGGTDPWTPGPGGRGRVYGGGGDPSPGWLPADFDFDGNGLWISPDCTAVIEGSAFRPKADDDWVNAIEPTEWGSYEPGREVEAVQAVDSANSIAGFVDWVMGNQLPAPPAFVAWVTAHLEDAVRPRASSTAIRIAAEVLRQVSPVCMEVPNPAEHWGDGLVVWLEDFLLWIDLYLHEWWQDDIEFDLDPQ